jgi:hypothetical protein
MNDDMQVQLEQSIHSLLCGSLPERSRTALLSNIASNDHARETLREMIEFGQMARVAYGYKLVDEAAAGSFKLLKVRLAEVSEAAQKAKRSPLRGDILRRITLPQWAIGVAAAVVVAVSLFVAYDLHQSNLRMIAQLAPKTHRSMPSGLTASELENYGRVWSQIADKRDSARPWILLGDSGGQFGYVNDAGSQERLIVLQIQVLSAEGKVLARNNMMIPAQAVARIAVPDAGRLWGQALGYEISCQKSSSGQWAGVAMTIGEGASQKAGISGRVRLGESPSELGQLKIDGKDVRVVVQAVSVGGTLG